MSLKPPTPIITQMASFVFPPTDPPAPGDVLSTVRGFDAAQLWPVVFRAVPHHASRRCKPAEKAKTAGSCRGGMITLDSRDCAGLFQLFLPFGWSVNFNHPPFRETLPPSGNWAMRPP